jgi:hypothetical protein
MDELMPTRASRQDHDRFVRSYEGDRNGDAGLKGLLSQLSSDATQLVHDELDLAKLELRDIAQTLRDDVKEAGGTVAKDLAGLGVALTLAMLAGLALTAGAIIGIGDLLDGAYWAGGLIVGLVLLIAAWIAVKRATTDIKGSRAIHFEDTKRAVRDDTAALREEMRDTRDFAKHEAREFRSRVAPGGGNGKHN